MKLLVAGGAGYVGSVVTAQLLESGHAVTVLDDLSTGHRDAVPERATFLDCSLHDSARVITGQAGFDAVLHFAAKSLVGEGQLRPELYWHTNVGGTIALLDAMRAAGVRRLVFSSTAATYGEPAKVPIQESAPAIPTNIYGHTKLAVDRMLAGEAAAHGLGAVSLRYFNVAGASHGFGERHGTETHIIPIALQVAAGIRPHLDVYGTDYPTPDGTAIRDYIHVADLGRAHQLALESTEPGTHRIFNLGSGTGFSVSEVVASVRRVTGHPIPVQVMPRRAGDPTVLVASSKLIHAELGWSPEFPELDVIVADAWAFARSRALTADR